MPISNKEIILEKKELEAFKTIYLAKALYEYLDYNDDTGEVEQNEYYTLFLKLGVDV